MIKQRRANWLYSAFLGDPNDPLTKSLYFQNLNRRDGDIFSDFKVFQDHESLISKLKSPDWKKSLISDKDIFYAHDTGKLHDHYLSSEYNSYNTAYFMISQKTPISTLSIFILIRANHVKGLNRIKQSILKFNILNSQKF